MVALSPSVLLLRTTLVTWVMQLVDEVHLKSLTVELVIEAGSILSEKVATTLVPRPMPVPVGVAALTLGAVLSILKVALSMPVAVLPATSVQLAEVTLEGVMNFIPNTI